MLRSLGFGFGLETFANFLMISVSVSKNLVSEKKVSVSVSENLVSEKKSQYRLWSKFWYRHSVIGGQLEYLLMKQTDPVRYYH